MNLTDLPTWVWPAMLGLGLAASTGMNTFLPLLMLASAAHFHLFNISLNGSYAWLASDTALIALGAAAVIETIGDKIPAVDHALHTIGLVGRPAVATLAAASVFTNADPTTASIIGLIIAAPLAFGVHSTVTGTRAASSATTFGFGNPVLSFLEDVAAVTLTIIAIMAPVLVPLFLIVGIILLVKVCRALHGRLRKPATAPCT